MASVNHVTIGDWLLNHHNLKATKGQKTHRVLSRWLRRWWYLLKSTELVIPSVSQYSEWTERFGNWACFRHQVPIQFGWSLSLALMTNKSIKSTTIFCHVPPYSPVAVNRRFHRTSWLRLYVWSRSCLLFADYLLGLVFSPEDGGIGSCEASVNLYRTTQRYIPADRTI